MIIKLKQLAVMNSKIAVLSMAILISVFSSGMVIYKQNQPVNAATGYSHYSMGGLNFTWCKKYVDTAYGPMYQLNVTATPTEARNFQVTAWRPIPRNGQPYGGGWQHVNTVTSTRLPWPDILYAQNHLSVWYGDWYEIRTSNYTTNIISPAFTADCPY